MTLSIQEGRSPSKKRRLLSKESKEARGFRKFATYAMAERKCGV